jgi:cysteine-rich repeat protein
VRTGILLLALLGCVRTETVTCDDGRTCPADRVCAELGTRKLCLTDDQTTACASRADGERCVAADRAGICESKYCLPRCGDGIQDQGEECDDENFASHDGCSSICTVEAPSWVNWKSSWKGRTGHGAAHDGQRLTLFGGVDPEGTAGQTWEHDDAVSSWTPRAQGPARRYTAMDYDPVRGVHVVFGGIDLSDNVLGDTWEYDGTTWSQKQPGTTPSPRYGGAMVYDPVRKAMVLFGGFDRASLYNETWEWNGTTWTKLSGTAPSIRDFPAMTWDAARQRIVMFGGITIADNAAATATWELVSGGNWSQLNIAGPGRRFGAAMAYSTTRGKVVLFGGREVPATGATLADTWEYDASGWQQVAASGPAGRWAHTLTKAANGDVVLVGGASGSTILDDVWTYGGTWSEQPLELWPSARITPLVYDSVRREVVVFSGANERAGIPVADTWAFDGETWRKRSSSGPVPRSQHALAFDTARGRVVMFGGEPVGLGDPKLGDETWEWDGTTWHAIAPAQKPSGRRHPALAYDEDRHVVVMFGGQQPLQQTGLLGDTWEYDGTTWVQTATSGPLPQKEAAIAYDATAHRMILFDADGTTWSYQGTTWSRLIEPGPAAPSARQLTTLHYDQARGRVVLYGGVDNDVYYADRWELDGDTWTEVPIAGEPPPPRQDLHVVGMPTIRGLVMFGGRRQAAGSFDDTWMLQYRSSTPEESCTNGMDDDFDLQIDAVDPDCD